MIAGWIIALTVLSAPGDPPPAREGTVSVRFNEKDNVVEVVGLDRSEREALSKATWDEDRWSQLLSVTLATARIDSQSIPGRRRVVGEVLRFEPRYPIEPGLKHRVRFHPSRLPEPRLDPEIVVEFAKPVPPAGARPTVVRVDPSGDVVPENLLKFYVQFSAPMSRGEAYRRVRLLDAKGKPLNLPFLEIGEELWDASGTRLTLLFDPGRIKRGLRPREEQGTILEAGKSYTLQIDEGWPSASGQPLADPFRRTFRAGPPDETQPDPKTWTISAPKATTSDPLRLTFPEPLDRAMLDHAIVVRRADGTIVTGRVEVDPDATAWRFRPHRPWVEGDYAIDVDAELEDLAGNSVSRPFEVDAVGPVTTTRPSSRVSRRFAVKPG